MIGSLASGGPRRPSSGPRSGGGGSGDYHHENELVALETRGCAAHVGEQCCCSFAGQRRRRWQRRCAPDSRPKSSFINHHHHDPRHRHCARSERPAAGGHDKTTNNYIENENENLTEIESPAAAAVARLRVAVVECGEAAGQKLGCGRRRSFIEQSGGVSKGGGGGGKLSVRPPRPPPHSSSGNSRPFASISIKLSLYCFITIALMMAIGGLGLTTKNLTGQTPSAANGSLSGANVLPTQLAATTGDHHFSLAAVGKLNNQLEQTTTTTTTTSKQRRRLPEPNDSFFGSLLNSLTPNNGPAAAAASEQQESTAEQRRGLAGHHSSDSHNNNNNNNLNPYYKIGQTSSDKVTLPGDILLGGLFPIHMKGTKVECGQINRDRGIQRLEAMLYALDKINGDAKLLPDIKLGAILLDSCSSSTYALNQSLEFIRASINTVESSAFECKDKSTPRPKYGSKMIAGVIGGSYSEVSLQVANLLRLFRIPQVSYASTGTALSDKTLYDLFARTVPSDMFQARAIADIVLKMGWSYVSLVSSEGLYGDSGSREFVKQAANRRICIATHEKIAPTIGDSSYDQIVQNLFKRNATGVVLFTRAEDTRELLLAVKRARLLHNFAWVAADGWGTHQKLVEGVEEVAWGAITVELSAKAIPGFDQYMKELTPWGNGRNPWFSEYWQEWFGCQLQANLLAQQRLASGAPTGGYSRRSTSATGGPLEVGGRARRSSPGCPARVVDSSSSLKALAPANTSQCLPFASASTSSAGEHLSSAAAGDHQQLPVPGELNNNKSRRFKRAPALDFDEDARQAGEVKQFCSPNLRISESNGYRQEQKVQFVVDAVYAMAHALHKAWSHLCDAQPGVVCEALKELNGGEFYTKYLLNVSFRDMAGSEVKFDEHGDGLGRYNIYNFRQVRSRTPPPSQNMDLLAGGVPSPADSSDGISGDATSLDKLKEVGVPSGRSPSKLLADSPDGGGVGANGQQQQQQQQAGETTVEHMYASNVEFEYSSVGRWTEDDYLLALDDIQFFQGDHAVPESYCSKPCELGQAKIMRAGDHCCWICKTCQPYEFLPDEFSCQDCGIGRWPVQNKTSCFELPQKVLRWDSVYSLISLSVACLGIGLTLFVCIIFIRYIDTPVVKASGRELSFILLAGVAFCHLATFVLLSKPTTFVCGGQRFLVNFGFVLMYGSLLVKTNRISRIFNCARKSAKRPSFISPKSQMLITGILVGIQIFLTIVWFIFEPPGVRADSPEGKRDEVILKCRVKGRSFILSLVYNMLLITTCTIYAVKTRKIPENFNESKFIGFTMYTTIVIWLAFVTMFFGTNNSYEIQMNTMCVCISLSAYVTLFCLFSPKISIILLHPDKNVRKLTMNSATYKRAFKPVSSVASIEGGGGGGRNNNMPPSGHGSRAGGGLGAGNGGGGGNTQDGPSGGPVSTTSNVLNLDAQASRLHESSIVSNAVNSNSGASNCSQKTPTTLSQQLALASVCSNCGAHQLAQSVPTTASTSLAGGGAVAVGFGPSGGRTARQANGGSGGGGALGTGGRQASAQATASSSTCHQRTSGGGQSANAKILHQKINQQQQPVGPSNAGVANGSLRRQIKHSPSEDHMLARACAAGGTSGQRHRVSHMTAAAVRADGGGGGPGGKCSRMMGSLGRLTEMTSFTSQSNGGGGGGARHECGVDESISSLVNDSFMNTSLENTPCNVAGGHAHHLSSSAAAAAGGSRTTATHNCKLGSDSMLCNQSVHSLDYCSDCCPSLCQCSCQVCSSSQAYDDELDIGAPRQHRNSLGVLRTAPDEDGGHYQGASAAGAAATSAGNRAPTTSGSYDAMCILQLVHQAAGSQQSDTTTGTTTTTTTTTTGEPNLRHQQGAPRDHQHHQQQQQLQAAETSETASGSTMIRCRKMTTSEDEDSLDSRPGDWQPGGGQKAYKSRQDKRAARRHRPQTMEMRAMNAASSSSSAGKRRVSSDDDDDDDGGQESIETTTSTSNSSRSSSSGLAKKPPPPPPAGSASRASGHSLAYALQAAATSALGAAAATAGTGSQQIVAPARRPEVASGSSGSSHYKHRQRASGQQEDELGNRQLGGTIQASLEQVKALERARRQSMEAAAAAAAASQQRRKSGCFNYHDDYEYSYGLVQSDSGSDSIELQAAAAATAEAAAYFAGGGAQQQQQQQLFGARKPPPPVIVAAAATVISDDRAHENDKSGTLGPETGDCRRKRRSNQTTTDDDDDEAEDDDDFEHDGRVSLERSYSHRRRAQFQQQQPSNKDVANQRSRNSSARSRRSKRTSKRQQQQQSQPQIEPLLDHEHRINSVALITATLSAAGAIVESGGGGGGGGGGGRPAISADASGAGLPQQMVGTSASMTSGGGGGNQRESQQRKQQQQQHRYPDGPGGESATHLGTF